MTNQHYYVQPDGATFCVVSKRKNGEYVHARKPSQTEAEDFANWCNKALTNFLHSREENKKARRLARNAR